MELNIKGKNIEVTQALRDYIQKKMGKLTRYFDQIISIEITLSMERAWHIIQASIHTNGLILTGKEKTNDMYSSIDKIMDKLEKQIKKQKEKYNNKHKMETIRTINENLNSSNEKESQELFKISKVKTFSLGKPMLIKEAIKEMETAGYDFFIFKNVENQRVNLIYAKRNGYGLIDVIDSPED
ncbi:MAG: ribosome-associated translation inhibitor RaiA [Armatimonadetes bacterium]|nr:ribosome-associated translation inhibitor RaiA [Armatimonadota bacterium]